MITDARFQGLKALRDVHVPFSDTGLTVLVGPNGVGKSTVLEGLDYLLRMRKSSSQPLGPANFLASEGMASELLCGSAPNSEAPSLDLQLSVDAAHRNYRVILTSTEGSFEKVRLESGEYWWETSPSDTVSKQQEFIQKADLSWLPSALRLKLDPAKLAAPSPASTDAEPRMEPDGSGLATKVAGMLNQRDGRVEAIERSMARLVPGFTRLRVRSAPVQIDVSEHLRVGDELVRRHQAQRVAGFELEVEFQGGLVVRARQVSEGTMLALGVLTALHTVGGPEVLLMDDLERGLHPTAQQQLIELLKHALQLTGRQVVATTHSPDLVDACLPSEVVVLDASPAGTVAMRLDEHPEAERWLKLMRPGEFWSSIGEGWVREQAHAPS